MARVKTAGPRKLNAQHARFVAEYLVDLNAADAARRAGYSDKTAKQIGHRLLASPAIQAAVSAAQAKHIAKVDLTAENVLEQLRRIIMFDPAAMYDDRGCLLPVRDMPPEARSMLSGLEVDQIFEGSGDERKQTGVVSKVKFWNKADSLKAAMSHLALLAPVKHEHTGDFVVRNMSDVEIAARVAALLDKARKP